jgi:hypothetical protein
MSIKIIKEIIITNEKFKHQFIKNDNVCILDFNKYIEILEEIEKIYSERNFSKFDDIIFGLFPAIDRNNWEIDYSILDYSILSDTSDQFRYIKITLVHNVIIEYFENILYKGDYVQVLNEEPETFKFSTKIEEIAKNFAKILENISNQEIVEKKKRIEIEKLKHDFFKEKNDFLIMKNEILEEIKNDFVEVFTELAVKKIKTPKLEKFINKYKNI